MGHKPKHGQPGPMARPGPIMYFGPDGPGLGSKILARQWLGPGLGRNFAGFSEGPARRPDSPMKFCSVGPSLGWNFWLDNQA
jgi:hypothetical protein